MSEPVVITLKAENKAELVEKLRLGAAIGWEVRYVMDRDHARLLADAIEGCLEIEAETEKACNEAIAHIAALRDQALATNADTISCLRGNMKVQAVQIAACLVALAALWWLA